LSLPTGLLATEWVENLWCLRDAHPPRSVDSARCAENVQEETVRQCALRHDALLGHQITVTTRPANALITAFLIAVILLEVAIQISAKLTPNIYLSWDFKPGVNTMLICTARTNVNELCCFCGTIIPFMRQVSGTRLLPSNQFTTSHCSV
jgi:hypothetical protein